MRLLRLLPGPIERVWDFIIDPEKRARWFCGGLLEPKPGGRFVFAMQHKNLAPDETPPPEYAQVQDPIVTFDLEPEGEKVRLLLTHRASGPDLKEIGSFAAGWHTHWAMLIALLEGAPRPPFWGLQARLKPVYSQLTE
ncbi:MAG: SRPBCC domain-containing protein [Opitutaceae bacterium]|nr:SRPBCC domain-containing protein [Opitutaceae bacterium]